MRSGGLFWKWFLILALLTGVAAGASMWTVYMAAAVPNLWDRLRAAGYLLVPLGLVLLALAAIGARVFSRSHRAAMARLAAAASRLSEGDLAAHFPGGESEETAPLVRSLNRTRERLAAQLETIDRQRRTLELLLAQLHEGVVVAWPNGRIALINPAAVRLLNLTLPDEAIPGRPTGQDGPGRNAGAGGPSRLGMIDVFHAFRGRAVEQCIAQHDLQRLLLGAPSLHGPKPGIGSVEPGPGADGEESTSLKEVRLRIQGESGTTSILARASDVLLPDYGHDRPDAHQATARMLVLTDISEFERTVQLKTDFVANASHELRTPVAAIRASVETLLNLDLSTDAAAARRFLTMIRRHSERLDQMVADLLDLSRLETPSAEFLATGLDLRDFLDDLHGRFAELLETGKLNWEARLDPGCEHITASPELLRLVLDNLVDNAIKFTAAGGHIRIRATRGEQSVCLEVADDGCGIPEAEQERVFERFYQVDSARSGASRGTGLGLAIVKHAVAALRGSVELRSELGRGTRVIVSIPSRPPQHP